MHCLQGVLLALTLSGAAGSETVLLDFHADWCGPCQQMHPVVDRLAAMGYPVKKVNFDHNRELAARYGVGPIPCFVMVVDGRPVEKLEGTTTYERLEQMCKAGLAAAGGRAAPTSNPVPHAPASIPIPAVQNGSPLSPESFQRNRVSDAQLVGATVRLYIQDPNGRSCGSGTIIDARDGEALIVTCGHIFRDSKGKGPIEVDLFGSAPVENVPGRLIHYDLDRDLALVAFRTPGPVSVAKVAPPDRRIQQGDRVINVGCNNGNPPTARRSRVTALDKYLGPPNIEVSGLPVQGRSGGGLFSEEGYLIGVCNAADPADNEGLYAALASIHTELDGANLSFVYRPEQAARASGSNDLPSMPERMPRPGEPVQDAEAAPAVLLAKASASSPAAAAEPLATEEQAALEEIRRRRAQGAEVICVIRSRSDPDAPSEILLLDHASPEFLRQLAAEASAPKSPQLMSMEIPNHRQKQPPVVEAGVDGTRQRAPASLHPSSRIVPARPAPRHDWQPRWLDSGPAGR